MNWSNNCCTKFTMKLCLFGKKYYNFEKWNRHACLIKKIRLKVLQLFIYGRMIRLIGVRDIILEEWCDWIIFGLWRKWSDHTHQLWLSVELNKPSKPGYVNSAMYLAKKVKIKNKYKIYSATWVLIWNVILGSFCTNFATWNP